GWQRVRAAVVAEHRLPGHVARCALEHRIDQKTAAEVDGRADEQEQHRRNERKLQKSLCSSFCSSTFMVRWREAPEGPTRAHHAVVARLDPVIVIPPPSTFRSLNP